MYQINPFWAAANFGTLVAEYLFESSAGATSAPNTGSIGGSITIHTAAGGASIAAGGAEGSSLSLLTDNRFDGSASCTQSLGLAPSYSKLVIGSSANFSISVYAYFSTFSSQWGQFFWSFSESGTNPTPYPYLYLVATTGLLRYGDGVVDVSTGYTPPIDTTFRKYEVRRTSGLLQVLVDDVQKYSAADSSNFLNAVNSPTDVKIGVFYNLAGNVRAGRMDAFRFYNGNV